ncbi:MAG: hypothetical protein EOP86_10320, partial [Verrucomicrobiaceae bacterium]
MPLLLLLLGLLCALYIPSHAGVITTVAGRKHVGFGGAATDAMLNEPAAVALLANGTHPSQPASILFTDGLLGMIGRIDASGALQPVAGAGARLLSPFGLSVVHDADGAGGFYIFVATVTGHAVRRITHTGSVHTVAGTGSPGFNGDGGNAEAALLHNPFSVAAFKNVSGGDVVLYISDHSNDRVRRVDGAGVISTVAGTGGSGSGGDGGPAVAAQLDHPCGLAVLYNVRGRGEVEVYIADRDNHKIRRIDEAGNITTVAGNGNNAAATASGVLATSTTLHAPYDVAAVYNASSSGVVLYIADTSHNLIRRVNEVGIMFTIAGVPGFAGYTGDGLAATLAQLLAPTGVTAVYNASGQHEVEVYIADRGNRCIRHIGTDGIIRLVAG